MINRMASQLQAPFWSRIALFGVRVYPKKQLARMIFWLSAIVYSAVYFYLIALGVVIFVHALWTWPGLQNYLTTTLYDICYRNWWLVLLFVALETTLVYRSAISTSSKKIQRRREKVDWHRLLTQPIFFVAILYISLKVLTGDYTIEPHLTPVLLWSYVISVGALYVVDKYS